MMSASESELINSRHCLHGFVRLIGRFGPTRIRTSSDGEGTRFLALHQLELMQKIEPLDLEAGADQYESPWGVYCLSQQELLQEEEP